MAEQKQLDQPNAAPLWAVQSMVFVASTGTGVISNGIFFIAREGFGFSSLQNFGLGTLFGLTYIVGAFGVGPVLRRVAARFSAVSSRSVLAGLSIVMGCAAILPQIVVGLAEDPDTASWSVWVAVAVYALGSGAFWPIVESYLGGGRSGIPLRRAVGQFNIIWAVAVLGSLLAMGPALERFPFGVLMVFGVLQVASTLLVWPMGAEPGVHLPEHHEPHPSVYVPLLTTFRLLLPTSYYVVSVWSPYAPAVMDRLGVSVGWQVSLAAIWMLSRLMVFVAMERIHGWHGRWWPVAVGVVGMVGGISLALVSPLFGQGLGVPMLVVGLVVLGVGNGVIYSAALYYAMEVGKAEVEAGGTHEGLIGVGFAGGPITGLVAIGAIGSGALGGLSLNIAMLLILGVVLIGVGVLVGVRVRASLREARVFV